MGFSAPVAVQVVDIRADDDRILQPVEDSRIVIAEVDEDFAAQRHARFEFVAVLIEPEVEAMGGVFVAGQVDVRRSGKQADVDSAAALP